MSILPSSTPEAEGVPSSALLHFLNCLNNLEYLHGLTVFRHGKVILQGSWAPFNSTTPHHLFSLSKSFVSCAVGFALQEGLLKLTDTLGELFPEYNNDPLVSEEAKAVTIRNLLTMRGGQASCHLGPYLFHPSDKPFVQRFLEEPLQWKGGETFVYNSGNTYMLSAAIQKRSGLKLTEYLQPRLFAPLGIKTPFWQESPEGIKLGGWGLFLTLEELSRFTKMVADGGKWEGRQIVPAEYLQEATAFQSDNSSNKTRDWENGYGYQFWLCSHPGAYRGDGAHGQYVLVIPDYDMAITTQAGLSFMGRLLEMVWDELLPRISGDGPLPADPVAQQALADAVAKLALPMPCGNFASLQPNATYALSANPYRYEKLECQFQANGGQLILSRGETTYALPFSYGGWAHGNAPAIYGDLGGETAISAAWETPDTLLLHLAFLNEPTFAKFRLKFTGDTLDIHREFHLWFLHGGDDFRADVSGTKL